MIVVVVVGGGVVVVVVAAAVFSCRWMVGGDGDGEYCVGVDG
jgi:hypothetical protein